jgi:predicted double-glycine peptidase
MNNREVTPIEGLVLIAMCLIGILVVLSCVGCGTVDVDLTARPTQGLNQSCTLYALADYAELCGHAPITREERLRVWRGVASERGLSLIDAWEHATRAGWVAAGSYPDFASLDSLADGPMLASLRDSRHAVVVISRSGDDVTILDPRYVEPVVMRVSRLESETRGFYYRSGK